MLFLLACAPPDPVPNDTGPVVPEDTGGVPLDWGVVDACDAERGDGFNGWGTTNPVILVHGSSDADRALAEQVYDWYSGFVDAMELREAGELSEADSRLDLLILGAPDTNALLPAMNGTLPVWFEDGAFTFGGYRYAERGNGIALVHPNPWNPDGRVLLFAGNTLDGAYSTFTIPTGREDYVVTRGRGVVMQQGDLCREGEVWGWVGKLWDDDYRADWDAWVAGLDETTLDDGMASLVYRYPPGSEAAADVDALLEQRARDYAHVLDTLALDPLDAPIVGYLYPDNDTKGAITGDDGNAHANALNYEVHEVYGNGVYAATGHEDVHVIAWARIGDTGYALMGEGLAVAMGGVWWGDPLDDWATTYRDSGELPPLAELMDDFWSHEDGVTYPLAGHFVTFLLDGWGADTVKALYVAPDLDVAFETELGMTTSEVEEAWLASIP